MSGFEIAGIVLAAFSTLADAGKDYRSLIRKANNWWNFGLAFEDFMLRLDTERVAFLQNLDNLLSSTVIPEGQKEMLVKDISSEIWSDPVIQDELKQRITSRYYDWYITILTDIRLALQETIDILPIREIQKLDASGTANVLFRLKTSFSSRKEKLLNRIQDGNEEIFKFLSREFIHPDTVASWSRHSKLASEECKRLIESQNKSRNLYESFASAWQCKCSPSHHFSITSARCYGDVNTTNICLLVQSPVHASLILTRQSSEQVLTPEDHQQTQPQTAVLQDIPDLRSQVIQKNRSKATFCVKGKGILKLFGKPIFKHRVTSSVPTPSNTTIAAASQTVQVVRGTPSTAPSVIADICSSLRIYKNVASRETISLGLLGPRATTTTKEMWELQLLKIDTSSDGTHIGGLSDFLVSTPARQKRMQVALGIALNILSLSQDWIPPDLDKFSLTIFQRDSVSKTPRTESYLANPLLCQPSALRSTERTRKCLLALGIIILELLFGQTIESQPHRQGFMGPDGKPNPYTDMCTAMEWQKRVELEVGDGLPQVIQRCVDCDFGTDRDLSNPKFVQGVLEFVVLPLREFLSRWNSASAITRAASRARTILR